jgi:hypothetical protein
MTQIYPLLNSLNFGKNKYLKAKKEIIYWLVQTRIRPTWNKGLKYPVLG